MFRKKKNIKTILQKKYFILAVVVFLSTFFISYNFDITGQLTNVVNGNKTSIITSTTTTTEFKNSETIVETILEATTTIKDIKIPIITKTSTVQTTTSKKSTTVKASGGSSSKKASTIYTTTTVKPVAKIIINEIMYDYPGSDTDNEWIEIYNNDSFGCDIEDWKFFEDGDHFLNLFNGSWVITSDSYAIIARNASKFLINYPDFNGTLFYSTFTLGNDGGNIALKDYSLNVVDSVNYNSSWGGDGDNKTLERFDSDWNESLVLGGTPGYRNSIFIDENISTTTTSSSTSTSTSSSTTTIETSTSTTTSSTSTTSTTSSTTSTTPILTDHVVISEIYYDSLDETCSEFIELYNPKNEDVDISNWTIDTSAYLDDAAIPTNTFIKSYGFYLIADSCWYRGRDNSTWPEADHNETITLSNNNGWIILKDNLGVNIDIVGWGSATNYEGNQTIDVNEGKSLERKPGYLNDTFGNGWDSDNNLEDFIIKDVPEPQNSTFFEIPF
jgi:hypothetical protein